MGLAEQQNLLARLATDARYRRNFAADPASAGRVYGLEPKDAVAFCRQVERFAASLLRKRLGEVEKLLPLSRRVLGHKRFAELFREHALRYVPAGVKKHRADALAFVQSIENTISASALDLIRYESAAIFASEPAPRCVVRRFRHAIPELSQAVREGSPLPRERMTWGFWIRLRPTGPLRHLFVSLPTRATATRSKRNSDRGLEAISASAR